MTAQTKLALCCMAAVILIGCGQTKTSTDAEAETPLVGPSEQLANLSGFAGPYVIVDARRASDVAAPASQMIEIPIGQVVNFTQSGLEMEGAACDGWKITAADDPVVFVESDPNLADLILGPTDSPKSFGDQRENLGFEITCKGERFGLLHKIDDRVLIMPWANSSVNLILERPLSEVRVKAYQMQLKSMKFYDGALTGKLDEDTLRASRVWYEYRAELDDTQPIPARPAITENLLDALGVL